MGHMELAVTFFTHALALDNRLPSVWNNKGSTLKGLERYDEALECYDHAIALDKKYALPW